MNWTRSLFVLTAVFAAMISGFTSAASAQGGGGNQTHELKVRVYRDGTWLGGNAEWISGALVRVRSQTTGQVRAAVTNNNGEARFPQMEKSKRYDISVNANGWSPASRVHLQGAYNQVVNIALKPAVLPQGQTLRVRAYRYGTFQNGSAEWLSGVSVQVTKSGTGEIMGRRVTNNFGTATYADLQPGIYRVTLYKRGFKQRTHHVRVRNSTVQVSLALTPY